MFWRITLIPILVIVAIVAAFPLEAEAGGKRPRALVESVEPLTGQTMGAELVVRDLESRDLPLRFEYTAKGIKGWHPATLDTDVSAVPSSPEGVPFYVIWKAWDDLGTRYNRKVRLRVTVDVEKGKRKKSKRFEVRLFGDIDQDALSAILYPDLFDHGALQNVALIDTRDPEDFAAGTIPGAINLAAADIEAEGKSLLTWPKDTRLVFFCYGGL